MYRLQRQTAYFLEVHSTTSKKQQESNSIGVLIFSLRYFGMKAHRVMFLPSEPGFFVFPVPSLAVAAACDKRSSKEFTSIKM